ncbi:MAG: hypothetical protein R2852_05960 [Bacteroidia bacterium]
MEWELQNLQPGERNTIVYSAYPEGLKFDSEMQFDAPSSFEYF